MGCMKKDDVLTSYHQGNRHRGIPMLNVKWHPYWPTIRDRFKLATDTSPYICAECGNSLSPTRGRGGRPNHRKNFGHTFQPGGAYFIHEFGEDLDFWAWAEREAEQPGAFDYPHGAFCVAEEIARESGWEIARQHAADVFGNGQVQIYGEGRSGGWLTVRGLAPVSDWDITDLSRWTRYAHLIQETVDDLDYQLVWHLAVNVYESLTEGLIV